MDQMDLLTSLYSDFVMDDKEVLFHSITGQVSSFHDDEGHFMTTRGMYIVRSPRFDTRTPI